MKVARDNERPLKLSHYLQAGSPLVCFLPSCRQPFLGRCVHANDGHFYCSGACAAEAAGILIECWPSRSSASFSR
jgi:hypothetical protein